MSTPRRHHFVPAFYLRQWTDAAGCVLEHSIKFSKLVTKRVGPDATGFDFDLYAFNGLPPESRQYLEARFFNYVDGLAANALRMHLGGSPEAAWGAEERSAWSRFILAMITRHPDTMNELRAAAARIWEDAGSGDLQAEYELMRQPGDPATLQEYHAKADPLIDEKMKLNLLISVFDHNELGQRVNDMHWAVIDLENARYTLLTSDRPVEYWDLRRPSGAVSLPISPKKLFVAVNRRETLEKLRRRSADEIVSASNMISVTRARRYVWSHDYAQISFMKKYMSSAMEMLPLFPTLSRVSPEGKVK